MKINKKTQEAIDILGYHQLTPIQERVIPLIQNKTNVVAKSKTGSGKTASFAIPIIDAIHFEENKPQALVLACTRELALQIKDEFTHIGKLSKIKTVAIYGRERMDYQKDMLKQKCHVVVATPGRLLDHIRCGSIDLSEVQYLIIDEADFMLDLGFIDEIEEIMSYLKKDVAKGMFSATYPQRILHLIDDYMTNYEMVTIDEVNLVNHYYLKTENKFKSLLNELKQTDIESALIFCERQLDVDDLFHELDKEGIKTVKIHGGMRQEERFKNLEAFRKGQRRIMLATDVGARGIDIEKVSHVYHYSFPSNIQDYVHRSGRTGRVKESGTSILFMDDDYYLFDDLKEKFHIVQMQPTDNQHTHFTHLNTPVYKTNKKDKWDQTVSKLYIGAGKLKKIHASDIIGALCSLDDITQEDIGVIEVLQKITYVEIFNGKAQYIVDAFVDKTIKKKHVKVEIAKSK